MVRKCIVPKCLSEEGRDEDRGVTFHKIPFHTDIRPKWLSLCRVPEDKHNVKIIYVCSRHFLRANFCHFKGKRYMLRQGVLPSVFPWSRLKNEPPQVETQIKKEVVTEKKIKTESDDSPSSKRSSEKVTKSVDEIKTEPVEIKQEPEETEEENALELPPVTQIDSSMSKETNIENCEYAPLAKSKTTKEAGPSKDPNRKSTTIELTGKSVQTPYGLLTFSLNARLDALDFNQMWFPAKIVEVDYEESEVLIHFEKYSSKYDEWISMNSSRLRPFQASEEKKTGPDGYSVGEKCLASWSDSRKFPAVVTKIIDKDTYEVIFNDGFVKVLKSHRMAKADGRTVGSAPLFDPAKGTKQDRREKKRKINVRELFRKRPRSDTAADTTESPSASASSPVVEENVLDGPDLYPKWEKGRPVGVDSVIDTSDGPRKSVIVADSRLPPNWQKHLSQRTHGASAGKWDTLIVNPDGRKFRTRAEIRAYIEENAHLNLKEYMFNFSTCKRAKPGRRPRRLLEEQAALQAAEPATPEQAQPEQPPAEEENPNSLKIPLIDDAYKCPIEGCGKSFRRENLAQMHVKHYHPKYTKYLDSTPNVADLAYARTVGESLDKSPDRGAKGGHSKQTPRTVTPKTSTPKATAAPANEPAETKTPQPTPDAAVPAPKSKDSEILKLLNTKPAEEQIPKYPPGLPSNMYPDIKLKDLLNKSEGIPKRDDLNFKSLSTSTSRATGIKTLLPVKKEIKTEDQHAGTDPEPWIKSAGRPPSSSHKLKRKRYISESVELPKIKEPEPSTSAYEQHPLPAGLSGIQPEIQNPRYIVEGGEIIKIVRMKREEIINCTCGITEEDGLMIQCELCLCWQHAYCNNIERENQVPEKYICYICQNPIRQRTSKKYLYDQDWLKNGTLPTGSYHCKDNETLKKRFEKLKKSHDLSGGLVELKGFLHSLKVKMKIAEAKNHPKLYLWSKPWDKHPLPEKQTKEEHDPTKVKFEDPQNQLSKSELDLLTAKTEPVDLLTSKPDSQNQNMLLSILKSKDESGFPKIDLHTLIENNLEQLPVPIAPQPEAAIESSDCKLNLLDHISHCQNLVQERLSDFEAQVDLLAGDGINSEEDYNRTCQTVQMLLRDLDSLKELSHSSSL